MLASLSVVGRIVAVAQAAALGGLDVDKGDGVVDPPADTFAAAVAQMAYAQLAPVYAVLLAAYLVLEPRYVYAVDAVRGVHQSLAAVYPAMPFAYTQ